MNCRSYPMTSAKRYDDLSVCLDALIQDVEKWLGQEIEVINQ